MVAHRTLRAVANCPEELKYLEALLRNLQIVYGDYRFETVQITIGALDYVAAYISKYMDALGLEKSEAKQRINKMQGIVTNGKVKICKIFLNF